MNDTILDDRSDISILAPKDVCDISAVSILDSVPCNQVTSILVPGIIGECFDVSVVGTCNSVVGDLDPSI
jgi:hypothetical protein